MQLIAEFLESLVDGPDPKAASLLPGSTSQEVVRAATEGPGPLHKKYVVDPVTMYDSKCTVSAEAFKDLKKPVKMSCHPEENERVSMSEAPPLQIILHMGD